MRTPFPTSSVSNPGHDPVRDANLEEDDASLFATRPARRGALGLPARAGNSPTLTLAGSHVAKLFAMFGPLPWLLARFSATEMAVYESCLALSALSLIFASVITPTFTRLLIYELTAEQTGRAERNATSDRDGTQLIPTLLTVSAFVSALLLGVLLSGGTVLLRVPISQLPQPADGWLAWWCLSLSTSFTVFGLAFVSFLWARQELPLQRNVEGGFFVLSGLLMIATLLLGGRLLAVCVVMSVLPMISVLVHWRMCAVRRPGDFSPRQVGRFSPPLFQEIWPPAWKSGLGVAMGYGIFKIAAVMCSQNAGVAGAASFLFSLRLLDAIDSFARLPITGNVPRMVQLYSLGRREELLRITRRAMLSTYVTFSLGMAVAGLALPYLLKTFNASFGPPSPWVWIGSGLGLLLVRAGASHLQLYSVTNDIVWHIASGGSGVLLLLILWLAGPLFADPAAVYPVALIGSTLAFYLPYCMRRSYREFGIDAWRFELGALIPALALFAAAALVNIVAM